MTTLPRTEAEIEIVAEVREGEYGGKLAAIEPGGAEFIPLPERHGNPLQLLWTVIGIAAFIAWCRPGRRGSGRSSAPCSS